MLTNIFRKRGAGKGPVVESNPHIAAREYKAPAQEPSLGANGIEMKLFKFADAVNERVRSKPSPYIGDVWSSHSDSYDAIRQGIDLHNKKKFSDAAKSFSNALGHVAHATNEDRIREHKTDIHGKNQTLNSHRQDIEARINEYADKAKAWHAENPVKRDTSFLDT